MKAPKKMIMDIDNRKPPTKEQIEAINQNYCIHCNNYYKKGEYIRFTVLSDGRVRWWHITANPYYDLSNCNVKK